MANLAQNPHLPLPKLLPVLPMSMPPPLPPNDAQKATNNQIGVAATTDIADKYTLNVANVKKIANETPRSKLRGIRPD